MPKQKTLKCVAKRFKVTGKGKLRRHKSGRRHLMASKNGRQRRRLRGAVITADTHVKRLKITLGM